MNIIIVRREGPSVTMILTAFTSHQSFEVAEISIKSNTKELNSQQRVAEARSPSRTNDSQLRLLSGT